MKRRIQDGDLVYHKGRSAQDRGRAVCVMAYDDGPIGAWVFWFKEQKEMWTGHISDLCLVPPLVALAMQVDADE